MFFDKNKIAIDCQYDEKNMVTALICGKKKEIRKGMKLKDRSQYPLWLVVPEYNLKLHMDLGPNADMFKLYVGKMDFYLLPYLYDNEEKDDEKR